MRLVTLRANVASVLDDMEAEDGFKVLVEHEGPRAAAYLAWKFRRQLRKAGSIDFVVPRNRLKELEEKRWIPVAMVHLRSRVNWTVLEGADAFYVRWRLMWKAPTADA